MDNESDVKTEEGKEKKEEEEEEEDNTQTNDKDSLAASFNEEVKNQVQPH